MSWDSEALRTPATAYAQTLWGMPLNNLGFINNLGRQMNKGIIEFLIKQYGHRVDFPQPIVNTDNDSIQNQLTLVDKRIKRAKKVGLLWTIIGVLWTIMSAVTIATETLNAIKIFNAGLGVFYIVSGLVLLNQVADLRKKKVILETILYVNNNVD